MSTPSEEPRPAKPDGDASVYQQITASADPDASQYDPASGTPTPGTGSWQRGRDRNLPRCFGEFELQAEIARGGMGVVYKAKELKAPHRTVALKMILGGDHAAAGSFERFQREASLTADWDHPGIVRIHEVGECDGQSFFTMPLIDGGSLQELVQKLGPLPPKEAARLVRQLAEAVQFAHERGVIHRDIKPHNVLLSAEQRLPKLTDFGLARTREGGHSVTGEQLGTPSYMSPEQAAGKVREVSPRSDVYSLGAVLYCLLTGRPPFQSGSPVDTMRLVLEQEAVQVRAMNPLVPRDLETICLKCLRKEPENRYASAAELVDELVRVQQGEPIRARPVGRAERAVKWIRRNPVVAGMAAAVVLALAVGTTVSTLKYLDAEKEADKATRAREFLVSIFKKAETDDKGGNVTVRQLLAEAETEIAREFADQAELRAELLKAIGDVKRGIARRTPQAMILDVRGTVQLQSAKGVSKAAVPQALLNLDDRLSVSSDAQVQLVFLSDLHKEWLQPGREVTVDSNGCEPADAVLKRDDGLLMTFARLPKGTFYMGWDGKKKGVKTEIKEDFEIAVHDVTQGQWQAVMGSNPSYYSRQGYGRNSVLDISDEELKLFPVETVSWNDTHEFIEKLNEKERGRGYLYRLPTEAEWEYSCRGGATSEKECSFHFYFDKPANDISSEQANFNGNYPFGEAPKGKYLERPTRVGAYPSNKLGLCDMHGNVGQWCAGLYEQEDSDRVIRGGCWRDRGSRCQAGDRGGDTPVIRYDYLGFRLARSSVR